LPTYPDALLDQVGSVSPQLNLELVIDLRSIPLGLLEPGPVEGDWAGLVRRVRVQRLRRGNLACLNLVDVGAVLLEQGLVAGRIEGGLAGGLEGEGEGGAAQGDRVPGDVREDYNLGPS
jgi:hypothetical protein